MHQNSLFLFEKFALPYLQEFEDAIALEIGPDAIPSKYCELVNLNKIRWDNIDIVPRQGLTYVSKSLYSYPIQTGRYDFLIAGQVIEHIPQIWIWIKEMERILRQGGVLVLISPINWPYHEAPVDCWRIYPDGMRALIYGTNFDIEICEYDNIEDRELMADGRLPVDLITILRLQTQAGTLI